MNKYEFYSKLLQEDFPVKYRQDFAEHDSEQWKKIADLKAQLAEAVGIFSQLIENEKEGVPFGTINEFLAHHARAEQQES